MEVVKTAKHNINMSFGYSDGTSVNIMMGTAHATKLGKLILRKAESDERSFHG